MEDDCVCDYDSTWDTESEDDDSAGESQTRRSNQDKNKSSWAIWNHAPRNTRAAKDMQNYRRGYPNLTDEECSEDKMNNLQFYLNKFPSAPDDIYIESFLKEWRNDYKRLERVHSYIQWLFPLREPGVNYMASELTKKEIEVIAPNQNMTLNQHSTKKKIADLAFKKNEDAKRRLVESYELMLGFYGIRLVNKETGEVKRAENWKDRFGNLERNMHNNLRITRILKSLGELGFKHYQAPLVRFFLEETLVKKTLSSVKRSVLDYFLFAVLDKKQRQELVKFAYLHFEPKDKFVWCPRKVQKQFRKAEKLKDGDTALPHKEEGPDNNSKALKGNDKNKDKSKQSEESAKPQAGDETARNGNVESESNDEIVSNGNDSPDDDQEMDQSPSPDTATAQPEPDANREQKPTNNPTDTIQDAEVMQTDGDIKSENQPKKKREDDEVLPNNDPDEDSASGQVAEKAAADKTTSQTGPSVHTPLKVSKHSPSPSSEREGKIPRTDFSQQPDKEAATQETVSVMNGMENDKSVGEQRNGTESEDVHMESVALSSDQNETNS